jgi:hypothetical protein
LLALGVIGTLLGAGAAAAAVHDPGPFRVTGAAGWGVLQNDTTLGNSEISSSTVSQDYSLGMDGFVWDPRFNRFSLGLNLTRVDQSTDGSELETSGVGYNAQTQFFPGRPFPLSAYARRRVGEATVSDLSRTDRETDSWGASFTLLRGSQQKLAFRHDRSSFDLESSIPLKERTTTSLVNFDRTYDRGSLAFQYRHNNRAERVKDNEYTRNNVHLNSRTDLGEITVMRIRARHATTDATYAGGEQDDLLVNGLSTTVSVTPSAGPRTTLAYDYVENRGKFTDSASHAVRAASRFRMGKHWHTSAGVSAGRLRISTGSSSVDQGRGGVTTGVGYSREWGRAGMGSAVGAGYARNTFEGQPAATTASYSAELNAHVRLGSRSNLSGSVSVRKREDDRSGAGASYDESQAVLRWDTKAGAQWDFRSSMTWRNAVTETFNFGTQESEQISTEASFTHPAGGFSLSYSVTDGISEFVPDPASSSPFVTGTDLVNESELGSLAAFWRPTRFLQVRAQASRERRVFTTIGKDDYLSYRAEIHYDRSTWTVSSSLSHYQRENDLEFATDTWSLRIGKRFF